MSDIQAIDQVKRPIFQCLNPKQLHPHRVSETGDSLQEAEGTFIPTEVTRPTLTSPQMMIIAIAEKCEATNSDLIELYMNDIDFYQSKLQTLHQEKMEAIQKKQADVESGYFWNVLSSIFTTIVSAISIVTGVVLFATPGTALVGGVMIASGALSIINLAFTQTKIWETLANKVGGENETQRQIVLVLLPGIMGAIAATLSFTSAFTAPLFGLASIIASNGYLKLAIQYGESAGNIASGLINGVKSHLEGKVYYLQGEITKIDSLYFQSQTFLEQTHPDMQRLVEEYSAAMELAKQGLEESNRIERVIQG